MILSAGDGHMMQNLTGLKQLLSRLTLNDFD